jgi:PadR family transcriptional regulator PadR
MVDRELRRGTLEMVLLKLLSQRQMYGYELVSTLEKQGGRQFQLKEGTLYPILYRLEDAGFISSHWQTLERGVPRKYYQITPAGEERLRSLVEEWQIFVAAVAALLGSEDQKQ